MFDWLVSLIMISSFSSLMLIGSLYLRKNTFILFLRMSDLSRMMMLMFLRATYLTSVYISLEGKVTKGGAPFFLKPKKSFIYS